MARTFARIFTSIWNDKDFLALSSGAQRIYILAITQGTTNMLGVTTWTPKRWARLSTSSTAETVEKDVQELVAAHFAAVDDDTEEFWARNFVRYDGALGVPNSAKSLTHDFETVQSAWLRSEILEWFKAEFPGGFLAYLCEKFPTAFPRDMKGLNKRFLEGLAEPLTQPLPEPLTEPLAEGFGARERPRAHAHAPNPNPSPKPNPNPSPREPAHIGAITQTLPIARRDVVLRTETDRPTPGPTDLAHRLAGTCRANNHDVARAEAINVVQWAIRYVDPTVIEESIFWAEQLDEPPKLPRAIAGVIRQKAQDRGISMPDFDTRQFTR